MRTLFVLVIAMQALSAVAARAQSPSLGDVARQEEARRKSVKTSGKVYTNETLQGDSGPSAAGPASPAPAAAATPPAKQASAPGPASGPPRPDAAKKTEDPGKGQDYWRNRLSSARDALTRSQMFAEALQSRINALTTDFVNRDDPAQRSQIGVDRQKALAELDRVKQDMANQSKAIADIEEEARTAGVPPGWLR